MLAAAQDELAADAVPLALRLPVGRVAEVVGRVELVGEVEGVGAGEVGGGVLGFDQSGPARRLGRPVPHQLVGEGGLLLPGGLRQRAGDELGTDADAEAARQQLGVEEPLARRQRVPGGEDARLALGLLEGGEGADLGDPVRERALLVPGRGRQDEGDRLRQIAHDRIAVLEEPVGQPRHLRRPFAQARRCHGALGPAPGEERDGPELVGLLRLAEVIGQRGGLHRGLGGLVHAGVEGGEALHSASSAASSSASPE